MTQSSWIAQLMILIKGMAMGAADVVPGVSGGTIAFIVGIYERWVNALSAISPGAITVLKKQGVQAAWRHIDGTFLLTLLGGIFISVLSLAKLIKWLLDTQPIMLWSFFFGLVAASVWLLIKQIGRLNPKLVMLMLVGTTAGAIISLLPATQGSHVSATFLFFAGMLAICAMILPGISGSFILVLIGAYETVITAIDEVNLNLLAAFGGGAIIGLLGFSHVLKWLFSRYHKPTMAILIGFVAGSLIKLWPWKATIWPVLPAQFSGDPQLLIALSSMTAGFVGIIVIENLSQRLSPITS